MSTKKIGTFREWLRENELNEAIRGATQRFSGDAIMNAKAAYTGKLSKVIPELSNSYILLGKKNGTKNIAIIGSAGGSSDDNGLKFYDIEPGKPFEHHIDTGNNYKVSTMKIKLFDSIKVDKDGKPNKDYKDETYEYYVFK